MKKNIILTLSENEEIIYPFVWLNGRQQDVTLHAELRGDNSSLLICGIFMGMKDRSVTFNTDIIHSGRNTKSVTDIRAVFLNNASFSNEGMVRILKGAKNADGYFKSKILLFDDAKGKSIPSLEIDENEVKAGHGSTIGRPDPLQLFYMRSRGLNEKEAESLIVSGFFQPLLEQLQANKRKKVSMKIQQLLQK